MGLDLSAKGYQKESYHSGYISFGWLRMDIADSYNEDMGKIYAKPYEHYGYNFTKEDEEQWNKICNDDLDLLLWHSDCDGKLTYQECRKIAKVLNNLDFKSKNQKRMLPLYETLKDMINYCAKERKTLFFI